MAKKVVIIGAGLGGLASGALLAQKGADVLILESQPVAGGRSMAFERDGFKCDFGVHMFSRGKSGPHGEMTGRTSGGLKWSVKNPAARVMGRADFDFPLDLKPLWQTVKVAQKLRIGLLNYPGAWRFIRALLSGDLAGENDRVTLYDFVKAHTRDPEVHAFANCVCQLYFALDYRQASAGEFIYCFSRMFRDADFGYPLGGCQAIPDSFQRSLELYGGRILFGETATEIVTKNGAAAGVKTENGFFPADVVISNAGAARTLDLAGREAMGEELARRIPKMSFSNAYVTIKYALERPVIPYPVVFYMPKGDPVTLFDYIINKTAPEDPFIFMPVPSNHDPSLAPPGKQLVIAGTAAPPRSSKALGNAILDKVHETVLRLFPGFADSIIWETRSTRSDVTALTRHPSGEAIGLGQTPDQVGSLRLKHETALDGLYLVGADAGSRGIGTELAVASGIALADKIRL